MTDREALFRRVFRAHYRYMLAYALRRTRHRSDAEDAAADAMLVAWRRIDDVPEAEHEQRLWLYAVTRRTLANQHRGGRRVASLRKRLIAEADDAPAADITIEDAADVQLGLWALRQLSDDDQELVRLALWEELSHADIARLIDTSVPNVAVRLHRARGRLRRIFDARVQGPNDGGHSPLTRAMESSRTQESTE